MHLRKRRLPKKSNHGFTLIEVLLVLAILVVVAGLVVVNAVGVSDEANKKAAKTQIANLNNMVNLYRLNVGSFPSSLDALYNQPSDVDASKWSRVSNTPIPADPWNHPYEYKIEGSSFQIRCIGPDGQANTQDDITSQPS